MHLDVATLLEQMLAAAKGALQDKWPKAQSLAGGSLKTLAGILVDIEADYAAGHISQEEAEVLFDMYRNTARSTLLTIEGIGLLLAEQAINAAIAAVRTAVNSALGFALL